MNQNRKKHEVGHLLLLSTLVLGFSVQALEDAQAVRAAVTTTAAVPTITKATALKVPKKNADGVFKVADSQSLEDAVRAETSATAHAGTAKLWANIKAQLEAKGIDTSGMTVGDTKDETVRVVVNTNGEAGVDAVKSDDPTYKQADAAENKASIFKSSATMITNP